MWQVHDPQPRLAIVQNELCLAERGLSVVAGLGALTTRSQRGDDLAVGCKRLRRQFPDFEHVALDRVRMVHCSLLY